MLGRITRGLWARRRPSAELLELSRSEPPLGRRHVAVLAHVGTGGERTVGELALELGLSLPAASKLTTELESHDLVERREDPADRRRTLVGLNARTEHAVRSWLAQRSRPLEQALAVLEPKEREAFLKGLRALGDALMEESGHGPLRPHHRAPHRRGPHRHRPL